MANIFQKLVHKADMMSINVLTRGLTIPYVVAFRSDLRQQIAVVPPPDEEVEVEQRVQPHRRGSRGYVNYGSALAVSRRTRNVMSRSR